MVLFLASCTKHDDSKTEPEEGKIKIYNAETNTVEEVDRVVKTDSEWKKILTPEQYRITRLKGTERPFTCEFPKEKGIYKCVGCGTDLFKTGEKFDSKTGWPSFWEPVSELNIKTQSDTSLWPGRRSLA